MGRRLERKCSTGPEKWFELRGCSSIEVRIIESLLYIILRSIFTFVMFHSVRFLN